MDHFGGLPAGTSRQPGQRPHSLWPAPTWTGLSVCLQFEGGRSTEEIRKFWQNYEHPSINKQEWSEQEVTQLKAVAAKHGHLDWQSIAEELGVRVTPQPGPALAAARGSARATREGSWRRSEVAQTAPPPADALPSSLGVLPAPSPSRASPPALERALLIWEDSLPGSFGFGSFSSPKAGTEFSLSSLSLMKMVFEVQFSENSVVRNISFLSVLE